MTTIFISGWTAHSTSNEPALEKTWSRAWSLPKEPRSNVSASASENTLCTKGSSLRKTTLSPALTDSDFVAKALPFWDTTCSAARADEVPAARAQASKKERIIIGCTVSVSGFS